MNNTNIHDLAKQFASESARNEAEAFENAISRAFKPKDEVEQAFIQGYNAGAKNIEDKHWSECRQIAHYDDELRRAKELLKAAVEDIRHCMHYYDPCEVCSLLDKDGECPTTDDDDCKEKYKWCYEDEALALIEGGTDNA